MLFCFFSFAIKFSVAFECYISEKISKILNLRYLENPLMMLEGDKESIASICLLFYFIFCFLFKSEGLDWQSLTLKT